MRHAAPSSLSRSRFVTLALLCGLVIAYASTIVGPAGLHFVPLDPAEALRRFLHTRYVFNGSDQRSDWMGNLTMLVPMGFLLAGALWPQRRTGGRLIAAIGAFLLAVGFVLAVKFAQLFFPPRTVTLNYIIAQSLGSAIGIALFAAWHGRLALIVRGVSLRGGLDGLVALLQAYTVALLVFMLMPLDFALSPHDLMACLDRLPDAITTVSGADRPPLVRAVLLLAGTLALVPVGMLLTVRRERRYVVARSVAAATGIGFLMMAAVLALTVLLISGTPSLASLIYRTIGIAFGAALMRWLVQQDMGRLRRGLSAAVPWLVLPYLAILLAVNGLAITDWRSPAEALHTLYRLGLVPLFDYYIVSKADAARNIVAHAVMYAPVGVMVWLRAGARDRAGLAFCLGVLLALCVEMGRYLRPGLEGDINAIAVAGLSAWVAAKLMPAAWRMLEGLEAPRPHGTAAVGWRDRAAAARALKRAGGEVSGEIERY
ncbi:MAG TPA: VanZ family protein [Acetobacteraceae bacterium]|nr:VanZ family protein [Acetobacteraceae bacterium]